MKTNQIMPKANQSQNNNETILRTLDNTELEKLSGGYDRIVETVTLNFGQIQGEP
ncbi:MAG: hypothetical protein F6J95_019950 [Leptolyngbya sp. SIO1E4]|nr:hypothetical protein [Leptolyngbya sp. SIO1E4]